MGISDSYFYFLIACLPIIAFLYASVGHGGASGYIALMYLFGVTDLAIKPVALTINLFVAGIAFIHYWRAGYFKFNLFMYFAIGSIPLSFLGGYFSINEITYKILLGCFLLFSILKLSGLIKFSFFKIKVNQSPITSVFTGMIIGFISGLIGIGGGIILTPILLLLNWANIKEAAAVSALFIWVNSAAGLGGQILQGVQIPKEIILMIIASVIGGFIGSYLGSKHLKSSLVRYILVFVLSLACFKLILN